MIKYLLSSLGCKKKSQSLPVKKRKIEKECPICKSNIFRASVTSCGHSFCENCIDIHLDYTQSCPICRNDLRGTLLYPSKKLGASTAALKRVRNGIKFVQVGSKLHVQDSLHRWWIGTVKMLIPNGDNFPFLLISYKNGEDNIEIIPHDSERLRPIKKDDSKLEEMDDKKA